MKTKLIQILTPGRHTDAKGKVVTFTETDLAAAAAAYDPQVFESPLVVGHPKMDAPAYGWVKALHFQDGALFAEPHQIEGEFAELVNAGRFKKISPSLYLPDSPSNPKPGSHYLKHIGFLGAAAPAIKGLKTVNFNEGEEDAFIVEFGEVPGGLVANLFRRLRDWLIADKGLEAADNVLPPYLIADIETMAARPENAEVPIPGVAFTEEESTVTTPNAQDLAAREAQIAERERAIAEREAVTRRQEHVSFAERLAQETRIRPTEKDQVVAFMEVLAQDAVVEFGEGDAKQSLPSLDWFKGFLSERPKLVEFAEVSPDGAPDTDAGVADFAAPSGYQVTAEASELHRKASAYQAKHSVDFITAYKAVGGQ